MGYPVLTVKETDGGILIRQDRYLETGPAKPKDNETIWYLFLYFLDRSFINDNYVGLSR
jgi:aminopeptidase 2